MIVGPLLSRKTAAIIIVLTMIAFVPPSATAQTVLPDVTVWVHRVHEVDPIEVFTAPSFYYFVGVRDSSLWVWRGPLTLPDGSDVLVDANHTFTVARASVDVAIVLCEGDTFSADDAADLSGRPGGGVDDNDCPIAASDAPPYAYQGVWNLVSATLSGDTVNLELGFYRSSGDFDGSTSVDENDANVWFWISDNYSPPMADAGPDKSGFIGDMIAFDGGGSTASPGSSIEDYAWDFDGDGTDDATGRVASWMYTTKGAHAVRLRVTDSIGVTSVDTAEVLIRNRPPIANFAFSPLSPTTQQDVEFADTSTDLDGTLQSFSWDFGDGNTSTSRNPVHRYAKGGTYQVTLTVTDNDGDVGSEAKPITVRNVPPIPSFSYAPARPKAGEAVRFTDTSTDVDGTIVAWSWEFGDGSLSSDANPTHTFGKAGTYNVTLQVVDDQGTTAMISLEVVVTEAPSPWIPVVLAILALAAILGVLLLLLRRRRRRRPETEEQTAGEGTG